MGSKVLRYPEAMRSRYSTNSEHRWGGSRISRFNTEGVVDTEIIFPTALNVTACCFGGESPCEHAIDMSYCMTYQASTTTNCTSLLHTVEQMGEMPASKHNIQTPDIYLS